MMNGESTMEQIVQETMAGYPRHPKWQEVDPGTVIPAGQPIRWEYESGDAYETAEHRGRTVTPDMATHFVDSSWKPPLVLPTEPTWGIAVCPKPKGMDSVHDEPFAMVGRWAQYDSDSDVLTRTNRDFQTRFDTLDVDFVTDFIPLTDEQVARLEAAR